MIRKTFLVILFGWLIIRCMHFYGQQKNTLQDIWLEAEKNYPGILASQSAVESSEINESVIRANALPQVKLQLQNTYGTYEGTNGASFPQQGFFNVSGNRPGLAGSRTSANTFGSMVAEYEIFNFGRQKSEENAAGILTSKTKMDQKSYIVQLKRIVSEKYLDWTYSFSKLKWANKNAKRLEDIHTISRALSRAGLKPEADSILTYSSFLQALAVKDNLLGKSHSAKEKIKEFYNYDLKTESIDTLSFLSPPFGFELRKELSSSHPFIQSLEYESDYFKEKANIEKKSSMPSLKLLGGYSYRGTGIGADGYSSGNYFEGFDNSSNNFLAGLGITWNITSLYTNHKKSNSLKKESERLTNLENRTRIAMNAEMNALEANILSQQNQLIKEMESVKSAQSAFEMNVARYKSGLISLTELLQVRQILENAENSQINAAKEYWQLLISLSELTDDFDYLFNNL